LLEISHTRVALARGCWQKYKFKYIDKLDPIRKTTALTLGRVVHEAFELYYNGSTDAECLTHIIKSYDDQLLTAELADHEDLNVAKYTAAGMWQNYPHKRLDDFTRIAPEEKFRVRVAPGVWFVGRVDGLVEKDGKLWIREVKTTGLDDRQMAGRMRTSGQATGYVFGVRAAGLPIEGVMYDVIKKPRIRKRRDETNTDFCQRLMSEFQWFPDKYYTRHWEYRNAEELELFRQDMYKFSYEIKRRIRRQDWYRNTEQCWNFNSECPYLKICFQETPDPLTVELFYTKGGGKNGGGKIGVQVK